MDLPAEVHARNETSCHRATSPAIRSRAGGSLVEILIVVLIIGLVAAAAMTRMMEKTAQAESAAGDAGAQAGDLTQLLALWKSDPQALESRGAGVEANGKASGNERPLDTEAERQAYQALVNQLRETDRLGSWKDFLRERLGANHPLLVALEPEGEDDTGGGSVEIRWANEQGAESAETPGEGDPDLRWADGEPVRVFDDGD